MLVLVQNQASLGSVFPADFRTDRRQAFGVLLRIMECIDVTAAMHVSLPALADTGDAVLPCQHARQFHYLQCLGDRTAGTAGPVGNRLTLGKQQPLRPMEAPQPRL